MAELQVIFCRRRTLGTPIIRVATWSQWSHTGVITEDNTVLEAVAGGGVIETPMSEFIARCTRFKIRNIEVPDPAAGIAWGRTQLGKSYDYLGVLGLGLHREWDSEDKWWCSEYTEAIIKHAGRERFYAHMNRITPQHCWMVK